MSLGLHWDILKPSIETFLCQLSQHWNHFVISVQLGMKSLVVAALVHQRNPSPIWSSTVNARFRCVSFVNMCNYTTHPPYGRQSHHAMSQLDPPALYPPALEGPTLEGNLLTSWGGEGEGGKQHLVVKSSAEPIWSKTSRNKWDSQCILLDLSVFFLKDFLLRPNPTSII